MDFFIENWIIILVSLISVIIILALVLRTPKKPCIKCETLTRNRNQKEKALCYECEEKAELKKAEKKEGIRNCPIDGEPMKKKKIDEYEVIIDKCPKCKGIWLDKGELDEIIEELDDDSSSSFATGLILGLAAN